MKKILIFLVLLCFVLISCGEQEENYSNNTEQSETNSETETELPIEYTEEEYKALCKEVYNDYFFENKPNVGDYVKIHAMVSSKYEYFPTDTMGMIVSDITQKYNLDFNCLGCNVMHQPTEETVVPIYFGEQIYIMFIKDEGLSADSFNGAEKIIIYGEVIKNSNGSFILPKYFETEQ